MKSLKLSITFIGLFITSICFGQNNTLPNDGLIKLDKPTTVEEHAALDHSDKPNVVKTEKAPDYSKQIAEDQKIDREESKTTPIKFSKNQITNLASTYESAINYPSEDEIQIFIDNGSLNVKTLDANGIDKNSKLYKRVVSNQYQIK